MLAAGLIFLVTYFLFSFPNSRGIFIRRPAAALLGAVAVVLFKVVPLHQAYGLVDYDTLLFILGMMIVIGYLQISGFFDEVERLILSRARTTRELLGLVVVSSGFLSALFMNDTICLMLTPVVLRIARRAQLHPNPYLIALATASNIGSSATPMGNPQNMIIAIHSAIPFGLFASRLLPVAVLGLVLDYAVIRRLYPREFAQGRKIVSDPIEAVPRGRLIYVCLAATALLLGLFAFDISAPLAAASVAALLILAGATRPRAAFRYIDWELLLMFAGLFVVMGGVRKSGLLSLFWGALEAAAKAPVADRLWALTGASAFLGNLVSNVPAVVFLVNIVPHLGKEISLWLDLALASSLAGNLTIIGSVANLIVFESAEGQARVGFWEYFRAGAPVSIFLMALGTLYLAFWPS